MANKTPCPKCQAELEFQLMIDTLDDEIVEVYLCPKCKAEFRFTVATTED